MPYDLAATVTEIERQLAESGWDQPPKLYSLVPTGELLRNEPQLADLLAHSDPEGLTPVEQEPLTDDVEQVLAQIEWPPAVAGCALVNELYLLPDGATAERPPDVDETTWAEQHPDARDVRLAVGVLRDGDRAATIRIRGRDGAEDDVLAARDLVPNLATALLATFDHAD